MVTKAPAHQTSVQTLTSVPDSRRPIRLAQVADGPLAWRGSLEAARVAAIVGSRCPSHESLQFARTLATACAQAGVVVASGGAMGIDICAHNAALDAGGSTWAVIATPPERYFPSEHTPFLRTLPERGGTLVWTAVAGAPTPRNFYRRNRVLMAVADVVVVIQAAQPSGSSNAGHHALALHKPLLVVPGCPWDRRFTGSLWLLSRGATLIDSPDVLLRAIGATRQPKLHRPRRNFPNKPPPGVPKQLLDAISQVPLSAEEIAKRARLDLTFTLCALLTLSLENVVVEDLGGRYRLA